MASEKKSGWLSWIIILVVVAGGAFAARWYFKHKSVEAPEYQTAKVARGDITQAVTATGQLNPVLNVQVGSQISGNIMKLYADFNSVVTNGQLIAQLDPATYQANVSSAEGELANANASLELAQINARRAEQLFSNKLIAQSEYDQTVAALHQAEAQVKIRTAALQRAKVDLGRCNIYSPVDGSVILRSVDVGQTVAASMSAPILFQIANDLTKMQIDANVAEADVGGVEVGQEVEFTVDAFPLRTFHGSVIQVRNSPITVQNVVSYDTVIEVSNKDLKLKPGMTANVSIITSRRENVVRIPNAAFRFRPPDAPAQTNAVPTNAMPAAVASVPPSGGGGDGARPEGGRRRGGGGGGGGAPGGTRRPKPERQTQRTIYVLPAVTDLNAPAPKPQPVQIKIGASDGVTTEVSEGLNEGDVVVVGLIVPEPTNAQRPTNPFGGGGRRGF